MRKLIRLFEIPNLICLDYPHQLIPALLALDECQVLQEPSLFVLKSQGGSKIKPTEFLLIQKMLSFLPKAHIMVADKWLCSSHLPVRLRALFLSGISKKSFIRNLFFAHDVSGDFTAQVLMQAFPKAKRMCFGDSLGIVYSHKNFEKLMYEKNNYLHFLSKLKRKFILPSKKACYKAELAILAIPCDPEGGFFEDCRLQIPPREKALNIIRNLKKGIPELELYLRKLNDKNKPPLMIFALSNLAASKLSSDEQELGLYTEIIRKELHAGMRLLIKPHPGMDRSLLDKIEKNLGEVCELIIFDEKYHFMPIEFLEELWENAKILSISYASISIPYLYSKEVKHVMNDDFIHRYIYSEKNNWFKVNNDLYLRMISAIKTWNGNTPLIEGGESQNAR